MVSALPRLPTALVRLVLLVASQASFPEDSIHGFRRGYLPAGEESGAARDEVAAWLWLLEHHRGPLDAAGRVLGGRVRDGAAQPLHGVDGEVGLCFVHVVVLDGVFPQRGGARRLAV